MPWDCTDRYLGAYWRRPERYLEPEARNAISSFAQLPGEVVSAAFDWLKSDLDAGVWAERYLDHLKQDEMDLGYLMVVAGSATETGVDR